MSDQWENLDKIGERIDALVAEIVTEINAIPGSKQVGFSGLYIALARATERAKGLI